MVDLPANQAAFQIEKIYVKDASVEIPNAPQIFLVRENPQIDVQLNSQAAGVGEGMFEVMVTATVTAKIGEKTMFLVEVAQAGIFRIGGLSKEDLDVVLAVGCPNILYPYLREVVSDVSVRAGFAPVLLNPINFEVLYQQQKQQQQAAAEAPATTH